MKMSKFKIILTVAILSIMVAFYIYQNNKVEWLEKDEYHKVMSQTFHPAEDGNLDPIRKRSGEMVEKAIKWQQSNIPAEFKNTMDIKDNLNKLVNGSLQLDVKIKANAPDTTIKADLTGLHEVFHDIVGMCKK